MSKSKPQNGDHIKLSFSWIAAETGIPANQIKPLFERIRDNRPGVHHEDLTALKRRLGEDGLQAAISYLTPYRQEEKPRQRRNQPPTMNGFAQTAAANNTQEHAIISPREQFMMIAQGLGISRSRVEEHLNGSQRLDQDEVNCMALQAGGGYRLYELHTRNLAL